MADLAIDKQNLVSLKLIAYDFFKTGCCKWLSCAYVLRSIEANPVFFCTPPGAYKLDESGSFGTRHLKLFEFSVSGGI